MTVSLETVGGKGMDYHFAEKRALLDKPWDVVVMHGYSTLDIDHPGNPALLVSSAKQMTDMFRAKNPKGRNLAGRHLEPRRPDLSRRQALARQAHPADGQGRRRRLRQCGEDAKVTGVVPVGLAWNRAFDTGVAGDNPYAGIPAGKINLWTWDSYHASAYGYYLEALMVFAKVTGKDPLVAGRQRNGGRRYGLLQAADPCAATDRA